MMCGDLDKIPSPGNPESDAIASLESIRADVIRIGKLISDVRGSAQGYPLLLHTLESMQQCCLSVLQISETIVATLREREGKS